MKGQKRLRDYGIKVGELKTGERNAITDVKGVKVGHVTIDKGSVKTGVTVVIPHEGNIFKDKVTAASHIINGFGKTTGTIQIEELGTIETPIVLTNTLSVGIAYDALVDYMLKDNGEIGRRTGTVNPVVCECNDGYLNDIRGKHVKKEHVFQGLEEASVEFKEGGVGAGTGMSCYGLKGGVGTSSRQITLDGQIYTVGLLVLSNFGRLKDLIINGDEIGKKIGENVATENVEKDNGSIIMILATDLPLSHRQLKRLLKRTTIGIGRTGSFMEHGSGDIAIGFTTANKIRHNEANQFVNIQALKENDIDLVFRAVIEGTEEAILNSLICAETTKGRENHVRHALKMYLNDELK